MPELPVISGQKAIKVLVKLDFVVVRQKGSHVFLQRGHDTVTIPLHDPLKKGTLKTVSSNRLMSAGRILEETIENFVNP